MLSCMFNWREESINEGGGGDFSPPSWVGFLGENIWKLKNIFDGKKRGRQEREKSKIEFINYEEKAIICTTKEFSSFCESEKNAVFFNIFMFCFRQILAAVVLTSWLSSTDD